MTAESPVRQAASSLASKWSSLVGVHPGNTFAMLVKPAPPAPPQPQPPASIVGAPFSPDVAPAPDATPSATPPSAAPVIAAPGPMLTRDVVYNKPTTVTFNEPTPVQVIINVTREAVAESFDNLPGAVKTHAISISPDMTAELTGPAERVRIQLRPGFPAWQKANGANPTWIWDVTALAPGTARLDLAIKARIEGSGAEQVVRTYHDAIPVTMPLVDSVKWWIAQIDPIWKWLIGVFTVLGGAIVWWLTNIMRRKPST